MGFLIWRWCGWYFHKLALRYSRMTYWLRLTNVKLILEEKSTLLNNSVKKHFFGRQGKWVFQMIMYFPLDSHTKICLYWNLSHTFRFFIKSGHIFNMVSALGIALGQSLGLRPFFTIHPSSPPNTETLCTVSPLVISLMFLMLEIW